MKLWQHSSPFFSGAPLVLTGWNGVDWSSPRGLQNNGAGQSPAPAPISTSRSKMFTKKGILSRILQMIVPLILGLKTSCKETVQSWSSCPGIISIWDTSSRCRTSPAAPTPNNLAIRSKCRFWVVSRGFKLFSVLSWHQTSPTAASSGASNRVSENLWLSASSTSRLPSGDTCANLCLPYG